MSNITILSDDLKSGLTSLLKAISNQVSQWYGYGVKVIRELPARMQSNQNVAIAVIASVNLLGLFVIHRIANKFQSNGDADTKQLSTFQKFNNLVVNVGLVGAATYGLNKLLCNQTRYPISNGIFIAFAVGSVALRLMTCRTEANSEPVQKSQ